MAIISSPSKATSRSCQRGIATAFGDCSPLGRAHRLTCAAPKRRGDKGHGRIEVRKIAVSSEAVAHLEWPGLAQIARIERHRHSKGRDSIEVAYVITSLPAQSKASPERLLELNRGSLGHRK